MGTYEYSYDKNNWIIAKVQVKQLDSVLQAQGNCTKHVLNNIEYPIKGAIDEHIITSISCSKDHIFRNRITTGDKLPSRSGHS